MSRLIKIADCTGAHGIKGEIKLRVYLEDSQAITTFSEFYDAEGKPLPALKVVGKIGQGVIAMFPGIATRNDAENLKNTAFYILRSQLPVIEEEWYYQDLIGYHAVFEGSALTATVTAMHDYGAGDILELLCSNGEEVLLPFNAQTVLEISQENRTIRLSQPTEI